VTVGGLRWQYCEVHAAAFPAAPRPGRRRPEWALAIGVVVGAHALLLAGGPAGPQRDRVGARPALPPALTVRKIAAARPAPDPVVASARAAPIRARQPVPAHRPVPAAGQGPPERPDGAASAPGADPPPATVLSEGAPPPPYPTRIAPPFRLRYDLKRGAQTGTAELRFESGPNGYELSFDGSLPGPGAIGLVSRGALGADGLAPERFVDRRRGRDRHAANFDRAAARITYSGPQVIQPLPPGAQDRLSWLVQLPAVVDADPARWIAGARVSIFVSGARGDADVWNFVVQGRESVELTSGQVPDTLRLARAPSRPFDTQADVWLDPARHHLPVRARLTTLPGGETLDLQRSE